MKIVKIQQIEKSCDTTKHYNPRIQAPYLDLDHVPPVLVATNGQILAVIPATETKNDTAGYVDGDAIKAARKTTGARVRESEVQCLEKFLTLTNGQQFPRDNPGVFPEWRAILQKADRPGTFKIGINAELLKTLADSLGAEILALEIHPDNPIQAIRCTVAVGKSFDIDKEHTVGVFMPYKIKS